MSYPPYPPSDTGYSKPSAIGFQPPEGSVGWTLPGGAGGVPAGMAFTPSYGDQGQPPSQGYPYPPVGQNIQQPVHTLSYNPGVTPGMRPEGASPSLQTGYPSPYPAGGGCPGGPTPGYPAQGGYPQGYPPYGSASSVGAKPGAAYPSGYHGAYPAAGGAGYPAQQQFGGQATGFGGAGGPPPSTNISYGQGSPGSLPYGGGASILPPGGQYFPGGHSSSPYGQQPYQSSGATAQGQYNKPGMQQPGRYGGQYYGTVRPFPDFHPDRDAEALHKAMKGLGCNEKAVVEIICRRTNAQRQQIRTTYKSFFGRDLLEALRSELRGDLQDAILALVLTPAEFDAAELFRSMDGIGTNELVLIEILTTRTNAEITEIKQKYQEMFHKDLEKCLRSETSGHFRKLLVALSVGARDESITVDRTRAAADAQALYAAGAKRLGTEESVFIRIIGSQNPYQLNAVFDEYQKVCGKPIEHSIKEEFSGDIALALLTLVKVVRNRPAYFAERLYQAMKGLGTDDRTLIRIIVSRSEVDLALIRDEFFKLYGKSLETFIKDDTSGKYEACLVTIVGS